MQVKSNAKAGGTVLNHNQATKGLRVKTKVKAGDTNDGGNGDGVKLNHNQTVKGLRVRSSVKAGGLSYNHSQTVTR